VHPVGAAIGGTGGVTAGPTNYGNKDDYIPHHEPFQYYASTANPHHLPPASLAAIGTDTQTTIGGVPQFDTANHQYDTSDFNSLVGAIAHGFLSPGHLPAVSFLKAPGYQDGHAGYSDPLDEQTFLVQTINRLQRLATWNSTAVISVTVSAKTASGPGLSAQVKLTVTLLLFQPAELAAGLTVWVTVGAMLS